MVTANEALQLARKWPFLLEPIFSGDGSGDFEPKPNVLLSPSWVMVTETMATFYPTFQYVIVTTPSPLYPSPSAIITVTGIKTSRSIDAQSPPVTKQVDHISPTSPSDMLMSTTASVQPSSSFGFENPSLTPTPSLDSIAIKSPSPYFEQTSQIISTPTPNLRQSPAENSTEVDYSPAFNIESSLNSAGVQIEATPTVSRSPLTSLLPLPTSPRPEILTSGPVDVNVSISTTTEESKSEPETDVTTVPLNPLNRTDNYYIVKTLKIKNEWDNMVKPIADHLLRMHQSGARQLNQSEELTINIHNLDHERLNNTVKVNYTVARRGRMLTAKEALDQVAEARNEEVQSLTSHQKQVSLIKIQWMAIILLIVVTLMLFAAIAAIVWRKGKRPQHVVVDRTPKDPSWTWHRTLDLPMQSTAATQTVEPKAIRRTSDDSLSKLKTLRAAHTQTSTIEFAKEKTVQVPFVRIVDGRKCSSTFRFPVEPSPGVGPRMKMSEQTATIVRTIQEELNKLHELRTKQYFGTFRETTESDA
ncbi:hypothetical protein HDE_13715 [Halotydeus destructor]|nr:hypothetical protein HDE_13715 [Halotydeus destructor]